MSFRSGVNRFARRVRSAAGGCVVVLTYHRIGDTTFDPHGLAVSPERFADHVAAFSERYELVPVGTLLRALAASGRLPKRGVALTFDDGYADVLTAAHPVLAAHGAPATVFVASGGLGQRAFWWDELEGLLISVPLPERLHVRVGSGKVESIETAGDAPQLHLRVSALLRPLPPSERVEALDDLAAQLGRPVPAASVDKRPLTAEELRTLAEDGLVEIGGHTVNHPWLASLSFEEQRAEIAGGKRALEEMLGGSIVSFSYPYGTAESFRRETRQLVREAGFLGALTTELGEPLPWGSASFDSDRWALPRMPTADVPASELIPLIDKRLGL